MDLYLMRHGIAAPQDTAEFPSDRDRPLTAKGINRIQKVAKGVGAVNAVFDRILTSPLPRARQTAQIVAEFFKLEESLEEIPQLAPEGKAKDLIARLATYRDSKGLLLVGHQPLLSETAGYLLCGDRNLELNLKKGGLCYIELETLGTEGRGSLHWFLTPKLLRRLGAR